MTNIFVQRPMMLQTVLLSLTFFGAVSTSSFSSYVAYWFIQELGNSSAYFSLYAGASVIITVVCNYWFGVQQDKGRNGLYLVVLNSICFSASAAILIFIKVGVLALVFINFLTSFANGHTGIIYALARKQAPIGRKEPFMARIRAMTSFGWIIGPFSTFTTLKYFGSNAVLVLFLIYGAVWTIIAFVCYYSFDKLLRSGIDPESHSQTAYSRPVHAVVICCFFAFAHVVCSSALPLFYITELRLPTYIPGLSFSIKCTIEVIAVLLSPYLHRRIGGQYTILCSAAFGLAAFTTFFSSTTSAEVLLGAALEGAFYGLFASTALSILQADADQNIGLATSLYVNSLFAGSFLGSIAMGVLADLFSYRAAFEAACVAILFGAIFLFLRPPTSPVIKRSFQPGK